MKFILGYFSSVGLKVALAMQKQKGGVHDDQKLNSMCGYILQSKSDGTVKNYSSYFKTWRCTVIKTVIKRCQLNLNT